jgi:hypothetical protein
MEVHGIMNQPWESGESRNGSVVPNRRNSVVGSLGQDYAQQLCGFYCSNKRNSEMGFWGENCSADRYADQHAVVKKRTEEKGDHKNGRMRSSRCDVFTQTFNRG